MVYIVDITLLTVTFYQIINPSSRTSLEKKTKELNVRRGYNSGLPSGRLDAVFLLAFYSLNSVLHKTESRKTGRRQGKRLSAYLSLGSTHTHSLVFIHLPTCKT